MKIFVKTVNVAVVILFGLALVACSDTPSNNVIKKLILQSSPYISKLEIIKVGKYDKGLNHCPVRAKYQWATHSAWREERVTDFKFFKVIGEWKLYISTTNIARKPLS